MKHLIFLSLAAALLTACSHPDPNKQIDAGTVKGETYHCPEVGWTINIPDGWQVITKDKMNALDAKGKEAISKTYNGDIDTKELKNLISFQKDQFNMFESTAQPLKEDTVGQYQQQNKAVNALVYDTYTSQGIKVDTASGKETIQGIVLNKLTMTIYAPNGEILLHQVMFSQLINGYDFGASISYNNEDDKKIMLDAFKNSKFDKNYPVK